MKKTLTVIICLIALSGCTLLKKNKTKTTSGSVQATEQQYVQDVQVKEEVKQEAEVKKESATETETTETETTTEETFDKEGNLLNRKTTIKKASGKAKTRAQESVKQNTISQSDLNFTHTEILRSFGQQYATTESKIKEVKGMGLLSYIVIGFIILLGIVGVVIYRKIPPLYRF